MIARACDKMARSVTKDNGRDNKGIIMGNGAVTGGRDMLY